MSCIDFSSFVSCNKRRLHKFIKTCKFIYNNEKKKEISYQRQSNLQDEAQLSVPYKVSSLLLPRKKKLVFFSLHDFDFAQGSYRARTWEEIKERRKDALGRNI